MAENQSNNSIFAQEQLDSSMDQLNKLKEAKAAYRIQTFIAVQALRRQKEENSELRFSLKTMSDKVEALQLQKYALRQLLDAEKIRLAIMNNDVHKIINNLDDCRQEKDSLLKEKEQLETKVKALEDKFARLENEYQNQKNDLLTSKLEARSWEKELEKEREKLSKIKSEKKLSIEDVQEFTEDSKESGGGNSRKMQRESRIKSIACRNSKKNSTRPREVGKVDFGRN